MSRIISIEALEVLDSRGFPTLKVAVVTEKGNRGVAFVPSGASTGKAESLELRDQDPKRYGGKGVRKAIGNVEGALREIVIGKDCLDQRGIDEAMIRLDGTSNRSSMGANSLLAISLAVARSAALDEKLPLYRYLAFDQNFLLPCPMVNILNGGAHADNCLDFQELMIRPIGASSFSEAIRWSAEVFHALKLELKSLGLATSVGDEGGFAPNILSLEKALDVIVKSIEQVGLVLQKEMTLALDVAASEFYDEKKALYIEKKKKAKGERFQERSSLEQVQYLANLVKNYPIDSIEDGLSEEDWKGWRLLTEVLGDKIQLVGDDLFVTKSSLLKRGIEEKVANAILIKPNQIGTLTETLDCIRYAKENQYATIISHRSGETEDSFIADLAVAVGSGQIKTGSLSRSERVCKYNRLLEIEKELGSHAKYANYTNDQK